MKCEKNLGFFKFVAENLQTENDFEKNDKSADSFLRFPMFGYFNRTTQLLSKDNAFNTLALSNFSGILIFK